MVVHDAVVPPEVEWRHAVQVLAVRQHLEQRGRVQRPVDPVDHRMQYHCDRPGDDRQYRRADPSRDVLAERIDEEMHKSIVLAAVDPGEYGAPRTNEAHQGLESRLGIWEVVENPDRIDKVESSTALRSGERRIVYVALDYMHVRHRAHVGIRSFDGIAEV